MRKQLCAAGLLLLNCIGPGNLLSACGDKFVGFARGTRFQQAPGGHQEAIHLHQPCVGCPHGAGSRIRRGHLAPGGLPAHDCGYSGRF